LRDRQKELLELLDKSGASLYTLLTRLTLREDIAEELMQEIARLPDESPSPIIRISYDGILLYANQASHLIVEGWGVKEGDSVPNYKENVLKNY